MSLFGGGSAGNGYIGSGVNELTRAGGYGNDLGEFAGLNQGIYDTYMPQQIGAVNKDIQYYQDRANNGFTEAEKDAMMGGYTGGVPANYDAANAAVDLNNQRRGITPDSSVAQGAYSENANNAINAYTQARQQLGMANLQAKQEARDRVLQDYQGITQPAASNLVQGYGQGANIDSNVAQQLEGIGQYENQYQDQHSLGAALGSLAGTAGQIYGLSHGAGMFGMPRMGASNPFAGAGVQSYMSTYPTMAANWASANPGPPVLPGYDGTGGVSEVSEPSGAFYNAFAGIK